MDEFIDALVKELRIEWASRLRSELTNWGILDPAEWNVWVRYVTSRLKAYFAVHADAQERKALHES